MLRLPVLLMALGLALAGCAQEATPAERVALVSAVTQDAKTAKIALEQTMETAQGNLELTGEGVVDFAKGAGSMTLTPSGEAGQMGLQGNIETRFEGTMVYLKMPTLTQQMGVQTPWISMDLSKLPEGRGLEQLQQLSNDPSDTLDMLEAVGDDIEEVGEEEVRGEPTTHYKATIDVKRVLELTSEGPGSPLGKQFDAMGLDRMPTELWIDGEGRLRRQTVTLDYSKGKPKDAPPGLTKMTMRNEYFDFGAPVTIETPPESETTDLNKLLEGAGAGGAGG